MPVAAHAKIVGRDLQNGLRIVPAHRCHRGHVVGKKRFIQPAQQVARVAANRLGRVGAGALDVVILDRIEKAGEAAFLACQIAARNADVLRRESVGAADVAGVQQRVQDVQDLMHQICQRFARKSGCDARFGVNGWERDNKRPMQPPVFVKPDRRGWAAPHSDDDLRAGQAVPR